MAGQMKRWEGGPLQLPALPPGLGPLPWSGTAPPVGWLICDGSEVSRVDYDQLFAVIGEKFGAGDGSTTFNLPDVRQRYLVGAAVGFEAVGGSDGLGLAARQARFDHTHAHDVSSTTSADNTTTGGSGNRLTGIGSTDEASLADGGDVHPHLAVNFIIKT